MKVQGMEENAVPQNLAERQEILHRMICELKGENLQKAIDYVSLLYFEGKDKAPADLPETKTMKAGDVSAMEPPVPFDIPEKTPLKKEKFDEELLKADYLDAAVPLNEADVRSAPPHTASLPDMPIGFYYDAPESKDQAETHPAGFSRENRKEALTRVIKVLRLNFDDMAFVFHVSPLRVLQWFEESPLEGEEEIQLRHCLETADRVEKMALPRFDQAIRYPLPDGEFFLEKLKNRRITDKTLHTLLEIKEKTEETKLRPKGVKRFHTIGEAIELYSTPLTYKERTNVE